MKELITIFGTFLIASAVLTSCSDSESQVNSLAQEYCECADIRLSYDNNLDILEIETWYKSLHWKDQNEVNLGKYPDGVDSVKAKQHFENIPKSLKNLSLYYKCIEGIQKEHETKLKDTTFVNLIKDEINIICPEASEILK
jgi:hypothetical protein